MENLSNINQNGEFKMTSEINKLINGIVTQFRMKMPTLNVEFNRGISEEYIFEITKTLPFKITKTLFDTYKAYNGTSNPERDNYFLGYGFCSLEDSIELYEHFRNVYKEMWSENWLPIFIFDPKDLLIIDFDLDQSEAIYRFTESNVSIYLPSLKLMFEVILECLESDVYSVSIDSQLSINTNLEAQIILRNKLRYVNEK